MPDPCRSQPVQRGIRTATGLHDAESTAGNCREVRTIRRAGSSAARAFALHAKGPGFKSRPAHWASTLNWLDLVYIPVAAVYAPSLLRKKRGGWRERFGGTTPLPPGSRPRLLIHAVSVGEVASLRQLVPLLIDHAEVVISVTTDTGIERARTLFGGSCRVVRYPLDLSGAVRRFLDAVRPDAVALVELEVWPNFVREARGRGIPVCVINGRLSEGSFRGYRRIRRWLAPVFGSLEFVAAQDEVYADRFRRMGVPPERCLLTGSMKWDAAGSPPDGPSPRALQLAAELGIDRQRPLVVAGSTAAREEALIRAAMPEGAQLLCAPRKAERFDRAARDLPGCVRRSARTPGTPGNRWFLLDTIGELGLAYMLADVVVMGRTFVPLGGSDPIEPIAMGRPTIVGPHVDNFASIVAAFDRSGAIVRTTTERLASDLARLLSDEAERARLRRAGLTCIEAHRGASRRHADLLLALASRRAGSAGVVDLQSRCAGGGTAPGPEGVAQLVEQRPFKP